MRIPVIVFETSFPNWRLYNSLLYQVVLELVSNRMVNLSLAIQYKAINFYDFDNVPVLVIVSCPVHPCGFPHFGSSRNDQSIFGKLVQYQLIGLFY